MTPEYKAKLEEAVITFSGSMAGKGLKGISDWHYAKDMLLDLAQSVLSGKLVEVATAKDTITRDDIFCRLLIAYKEHIYTDTPHGLSDKDIGILTDAIMALGVPKPFKPMSFDELSNKIYDLLGEYDELNALSSWTKGQGMVARDIALALVGHIAKQTIGREKCPDCKGSGIYMECPKCNGTGRV